MTKESSLIGLFTNLIENSTDAQIISSDFDYLLKYLKKESFSAKVINKETPALLATLKDSNTIDILFIGHLDVVPANSDNWLNHSPFNVIERGDFLYGRGAVDMKASIAAFIEAAISYKNSSLNSKNIGILITSDEETDSISAINAAQYLKDHKIIVKNILIGEPTSENMLGDTIKNGRRGSVNFDLIIHGSGGHVAYPDKFVNPIDIAVNILNDLTCLDFADKNEIFPQTNLEIVDIKTNNVKGIRNIVPDNVSIRFNIRFGNIQTSSSLEILLHDFISKITPNYELIRHSAFEPFYSKNDTAFARSIVNAILSILGIEAKFSTSGGTSDGRFFHEFAPIIELGPVNSTMHKTNECIAKSDLYNLYKVYFNILNSI